MNTWGLKLTIEDLVDELEFSKWCDGVEKYKISETFNKNGAVSFIVDGLTIDYDDDVIWVDDYGDVFANKICVISAFLRKDLLSINKHSLSERFYVKLLFKDGYIIIESYCD